MSEWNPQIVKIEKIEKHPDPETTSLEVITVLGDYPVVAKMGQYKVGDLSVYLPIDTIVPDVADFHFLSPQAYEKYEEGGEIKQRPVGAKYPVGGVPEKYRRIKAKRIRGKFSMGMLTPPPEGMKEGEPVVEVMSLKKYEEDEEESVVAFTKMRGSNAESPPKGWVIPKYDIDGIRKYLECLQENEEVVLTEKLHGSNAAFCHDGERLWVRSRNWFKKMDPTDPWWDIAIRYDLEAKLSKFPMMTFFGELYGLVKGFPYDAEIIEGKRQSKIRFFDVYDVQKMSYLDYDPFVAMIKDAGLETVPQLYRGNWSGKDTMYPYAEGLTTVGGKHIREGFVVRTTKERWEPRLDGRMQVKMIGETYSLQK